MEGCVYRGGVFSPATLEVLGDVTNTFRVVLNVTNVYEHVIRAFKMMDCSIKEFVYFSSRL